MKIEIGFNVCFGIFLRAIHHSDGFPHRRDVLFLGAYRSQRRDVRLENQPEFREMRRAFLLPDLDHQVERLARGLRSSVRDESSAAGVGFDQTFFPERLHRLAHGGAADAETLRQFAFGRKLIARLQGSVENGLFDLLNDLLIQSRGSNNFVHRILSRTNQFGGTGDGPATIPQVQCLRQPFLRSC